MHQIFSSQVPESDIELLPQTNVTIIIRPGLTGMSVIDVSPTTVPLNFVSLTTVAGVATSSSVLNPVSNLLEMQKKCSLLTQSHVLCLRDSVVSHIARITLVLQGNDLRDRTIGLLATQ
jgi:hypothetical protein